MIEQIIIKAFYAHTENSRALDRINSYLQNTISRWGSPWFTQPFSKIIGLDISQDKVRVVSDSRSYELLLAIFAFNYLFARVFITDVMIVNSLSWIFACPDGARRCQTRRMIAEGFSRQMRRNETTKGECAHSFCWVCEF